MQYNLLVNHSENESFAYGIKGKTYCIIGQFFHSQKRRKPLQLLHFYSLSQLCQTF
jgi:hypothetical protein